MSIVKNLKPFDLDNDDLNNDVACSIEVNKELKELTGHNKLNLYDMGGELRILQKSNNTQVNTVKNIDPHKEIVFEIPVGSVKTFLCGKFMDFTYKFSYLSHTTDSTVLSESVWDQFDWIRLETGGNKYTITRDMLEYIKYKTRKNVKAEDMDHSKYVSQGWNGTGDFLSGDVRTINMCLGDLFVDTEVRTLFDLVLSTHGLSSIKITFCMNCDHTKILGGYWTEGSGENIQYHSEITHIQIDEPRLLYLEFDDRTEQEIFSTLWEDIKDEELIPLTGVKKYTFEVPANTGLLNQIPVPVRIGEQIKHVVLRVFDDIEYLGFNQDRETKVLSGSFKNLKILDGINGDRLFFGKENLDTTDLAVMYFLKKRGKYFDILKGKDPLYGPGLLELETETKVFDSINSSLLTSSTKLVISGEVVQENGSPFTTKCRLEVMVVYEEEWKYVIDSRTNIKTFVKVE